MRYDRFEDNRDFQSKRNNRRRKQGYQGSGRYDRGYDDDRRFEDYGQNDNSRFPSGRFAGEHADESGHWNKSRDERNPGFETGTAYTRENWRTGRDIEEPFDRNREFHDRFGSGLDGFISRSGGDQYLGGHERAFSEDRFQRSDANDWGTSDYNRRSSSYQPSFARDYERYGKGQAQGLWNQMKSFFGVGPKGYRRSDERIREDVSEALAHEATVDASQIEVEVKEGVLLLRGHVTSRWMKRRAEDCVEHLSGVRDVRNEIEVRSESAWSTSSGDPSIGSSAISVNTSGATTEEKKRKLA